MLNPMVNSHQSSFISNMTNIGNNTVENILMSKMEFFDRFILSPFTFRSLYLMLFRELSNDKKIKIIKSENNMKKIFLMSEKHFSKTRYLLRIIIFLFEKQNNLGADTFL